MKDVDGITAPVLPSWADADQKKRSYLGPDLFGGAETRFNIDPTSYDWLDEVRGPDSESELEADGRTKSIGEMMERLGSLPHFLASFDCKKLASIDVSEFAYQDHNISKEKSEQNLRRMIDIFERLPAMEFEHGKSYYIYGPNGGGKSVLSQAIMVAIQRKWHELRLQVQEVPNGSYSDDEFVPIFPRDASGRTHDKGLILAISEAINIDDLVTAESSEKEGFDVNDITTGIHFSLGAAASTSLGLSGAQTVNSFLISQVTKDNRPARPDPTAVFLDEPETSRDRTQLKNLKDEIENIRNRLGKETIALVPTHSEIIYRDPTALRIDLDYPEKGIHTAEGLDPVELIDINHLTADQLERLAELAVARAQRLRDEE